MPAQSVHIEAHFRRQGKIGLASASTENRLRDSGLDIVQSFEVVGELTDIEVIAVGNAIHELRRLRKQYGDGRWRKLKGVATIRIKNGRLRQAELHWYEAHGIGKKEFKWKRYVD